MQGSRASVNSGAQSEIARLRVRHNHLHGHWSSGTKAGMSYKQSDAAYKLHLGRIMELYLKDRRGPQEYRERQAMDNGQSLRETPLTLLYGVHGLAVDTKNLAKIQRKREEQFDNRVYTLQRLQREVKAREQHAERASQREDDPMATERLTLRTSSGAARSSLYSASPSPSRGRLGGWGLEEGGTSLASHDPDGRESPYPQFLGGGSSRGRQQQTAGANRSPHRSSRGSYRRCDDSAVPRDELALRGLYRLDEDQMRVYGEFVRMLSHFDHYDSVSILADALTDAVADAGLADFGGTALTQTQAQAQAQTQAVGRQRSVSPSKEGAGSRGSRGRQPQAGTGADSSSSPRRTATTDIN